MMMERYPETLSMWNCAAQRRLSNVEMAHRSEVPNRFDC